MAHFAKINEISKVTSVVVASQEVADAYDGTWVQTSYNTRGNVHYGQDGNPDGGLALRGNYAAMGYTYDETNDVFYLTKPYESWTINTSTWYWTPPVTYPNDGKTYIWDEDLYQADNQNGWVEIDFS
tara:strand:+ start:736 stop:1116 length:381 start_codon:yes stop_codon:yes gene_type:complete